MLLYTAMLERITQKKVFSALPTPNQRKTCIKHIFDPKNNAQKKNYWPTYPIFFSDRYRKQTISFLGLKEGVQNEYNVRVRCLIFWGDHNMSKF